MQNAIVPTTQRVVHIVTLLISSNAKEETLRTSTSYQMVLTERGLRCPLNEETGIFSIFICNDSNGFFVVVVYTQCMGTHNAYTRCSVQCRAPLHTDLLLSPVKTTLKWQHHARAGIQNVNGGVAVQVSPRQGNDFYPGSCQVTEGSN